MLSALSREFRKLDGVLVTDTQCALKILCVVTPLFQSGSKMQGYAASITAIEGDCRSIYQVIRLRRTIDSLAHDLAINVDGEVIERLRRAAQPSSTP